MTEYTDQERQTLRTAAFGAVYLVSSAEPGMLDMLKESLAGSKAFASASADLRDLLRAGGLPKIPKGSPGDIESGVLEALNESTTILAAKGQRDLDGFRGAVNAAVDQVAAAADDVSPNEAAAIGKVRAALGAS
jgi:hypothetical protein